MQIILTTASAALLCVLALFPSLYYRYYYLHGKSKPESLRQLVQYKKSFWITTIVHCVIFLIFLWIEIRCHAAWQDVLQACCVLLILANIAGIDITCKKIPNALVALLLGIWFVFFLIQCFSAGSLSVIGSLFLRSLLGFLLSGGLTLICMLISRGGLGAGDVKLTAILGLFYGILGIVNILFYACVLTLIASICMLVAKKIRLKDTVPMSPFIALGVVVYHLLFV